MFQFKSIFNTFMLLLAVVMLTNCKKDSDDDDTPAIDLLTAHAWIGSAATITFDGIPAPVDLWATEYDACQKDDFTTFKTDNTAVTDDGALKCDPDDPQTTTVSYTLSADGKTLSGIDEEGEAYTFTVKELTTSKLVFTLSAPAIPDLGIPASTTELTYIPK